LNHAITDLLRICPNVASTTGKNDVVDVLTKIDKAQKRALSIGRNEERFTVGLLKSISRAAFHGFYFVE